MEGSEPEVFEIAKKIRYDLTAVQAKVTDLLNALGRLNIPSEEGVKPYPCPHRCTSFASERRLALHMQNVHGGPAVPMTEEELRA